MNLISGHEGKQVSCASNETGVVTGIRIAIFGGLLYKKTKLSGV